MQSGGMKGDYFFKSLILFLSGILAHTLSGGSVVDTDRLFTLSLLIALSLFFTRKNLLEGPQLALMVLALQSSSHFLLGGADKSSEFQMSFAHIFAGVLSHKVVTHLDGFWEFLRRLAGLLQIPVFKELKVGNQYQFTAIRFLEPSMARTFYTTNQYRGPPVEEFLHV